MKKINSVNLVLSLIKKDLWVREPHTSLHLMGWENYRRYQNRIEFSYDTDNITNPATRTSPELVWIENYKPTFPPKPVSYANTLKDPEDFYISPEELCKDYEVRECVVKPCTTPPRYFSDEIPFAYLLAERTYSLTK